MEKNEATFLSVFDGSALWDEKETFSVLSEDGATRKSFFITPPDPERLERLSALANARRPDKDGGDKEKTFLAEHILWPCQVFSAPNPGVIWPVIPQSFLFGEDSSPDKALSAVRQGRPRKSLWFLSDKSRDTMTPQERGDSAALLRAMADLARAVAFLHSKGFACCGLSDENVLLDAANGRAFLTGTENFQSPDFSSPAPSAPMAYAAPEFIGARRDKPAPDMQALRDADLHALAVLFYRLLLRRHPLLGPKRREYGPDALFIEDPVDRSNRPDNLNATIQKLGDPLERLFLNAFTHGLRDPRERPTAIQWENALETAWRRREERGRDVQITKKTSLPQSRPLSPADREPLNLSKTAGEDASRTLKINLEWSQPDDFDLDISAFLLRGAANAASRDDMVFYGSPDLAHASNSVRILDNLPTVSQNKAQKRMIVEQSLIPPDVSKIEFVVTAYYENKPEYFFKAVKGACLSVYDGNDALLMSVDLRKKFGDCSACVAASLIRRNGQMALQGPGRGHSGGMRMVCQRYGIPVTG